MALVRRRRPHAHLFIPYNGKIADITHADTLTHLLILANGAGTGAIAGETRKIIMVILRSTRIAGTGELQTFPNEGVAVGGLPLDTKYLVPVVIANGSQRLQYSLSVANDDWDLYCMGYVVEV